MSPGPGFLALVLSSPGISRVAGWLCRSCSDLCWCNQESMAWRSCHSGLDQLSWSHPSTWLQSKAGEQGERSWSDSQGCVGIHRPGLSPTQGFSRESSPSAPLQPMPLLSHSTSVPRATEGKVLGDPPQGECGFEHRGTRRGLAEPCLSHGCPPSKPRHS